MRIFLISVLILIFAAKLFSQQISDGVTLPDTKEYLLKSELNHVTYKLSIAVPEHYNDSLNKTYPVVFFLDGNIWMPLAYSVYRTINKTDQVSPVILVGIGYEVETFEYDIKQRTYDYTPTQNSEADSVMSFRYKTSITSGGGYQFLQVLEQEIVPFVDSSYRTSGNRTIAGHSLGGLFATYVLLEKPHLFSNFIIASPAVWWDDDILLLQLKERKNMVVPVGKIILGIGKKETKRMKIAAESLDKLLRKKVRKKNDFRFEEYKDCEHFTVIPVLLEKSFLILFPGGAD